MSKKEEEKYQHIDYSENTAFIQIHNLGQKFLVNKLSCNFQKKIKFVIIY